MKNKIKLGLIFLIVLLTFKGAMAAFTYVENFASLPLDTVYWTFYNETPTNTSCVITIADGGILFNITNANASAASGGCYYGFTRYINMSEDFTITFRLKSRGQKANADTGGVGVGQAKSTAYLSFIQAENGDYCGFATYAHESTPTDRYRKIWHNKAFGDLTYPLNAMDGNWHDFIMAWDATTENISYYFDGALDNNTNVDSHICENATNVTIYFGGADTGSSYDNVIWIDSLIIQASATGDVPSCAEPCIKNETFNYVDSLCNHNGWVTGDCDDINVPFNGQYICNDSSQTLAKYFGKVTKDSGFLTLEYDLEIKSNYEVLWGFGSQDHTLAVSWFYNDGNITELKDNTNIGTYSYNTTYTYKVVLDLEHKHWDFYIDDVLQHEDIEFYSDVDNVYYFFIQPDHNRGAPYCDYVLDNVLLYKGIALIPTTNESYWQVGEYLTLDPQNASFDWDLACRQNEHPTLCFYRSLFEDLLSMFTNFVFNNFLLWLVLIIVLMFILMIKQNKS